METLWAPQELGKMGGPYVLNKQKRINVSNNG